MENQNNTQEPNIEEEKSEDLQSNAQEQDQINSNPQEDDKTQDYQSKYLELEKEYLRTHADFENVKKRLEREKSLALEYAYEKIAKDLLPVLDTLEKALESAINSNANEGIIQGLELTIENLCKVLNKHGIECIMCEDEFDPNIHECVIQVPCNDKLEGQIVQVLQKGYKYKERVLRPAMVSIAKN